MLVTDRDIKVKSNNIIVYKCSLSEIKRRAELLLDFSVSLENPHKLCDYKPLFGLLMNEFSEKYDFWGYCDSDLVFGNIRHFLTDEILSSYDYLLGMGHFHVQRTYDPNFDKVWKSARGVGDNAYYNKDFDSSCFVELDNGPQWKEVFKSSQNHIFDEFPYGVSYRYFQLYPKKVWTGYNEWGRCFDDVDPFPLYFRDLFNSYVDYQSSTYSKLAYVFPFFRRISNGIDEVDDVVYEKKDNTLYRIGRTIDGRLIKSECLYVHFLHRKMYVKTNISDIYLIRPNCFIPFENVTDEKMLKWRNDYRLFIDRKWQRFVFQINRSKTLWKKMRRLMD